MRTVVDIPPSERKWLDRKAREQEVSMAEALRRMLREARETEERKAHFIELGKKVFGTWKHGDPLRWQQKLRAEWDR